LKNKDKPRHLQDRRYRKRMARKGSTIRWVDDYPPPLTKQQWRDLFLCDWSKTPPGVVVVDIETRGVADALARSMTMIAEEMRWGTPPVRGANFPLAR
jgi:hypothetical protein